MLKKKNKKIKKDNNFYKEVEKEMDERSDLEYDIEDHEYLKNKLIEMEFNDEKSYDLKKNKYLNRIGFMFSKKKFARNFMICAMVYLSVFLIFLLASVRNVEYTSFLYQEDMMLNLGTLNLKYVTYKEKDNKLMLDFQASIKATESNDIKRPYIIIRSFDKKNTQNIIYQNWYIPNENEDIELDISATDYNEMEGVIIEIYEIRDEKELESELTKYIEGSVIFKQDFRIYEDLNDFFEEDKTRKEAKKEDQYIYKILYSHNNVERYSEETMERINLLYSKRVKKIHNMLEGYIKKGNEILQNEKQVLIDLGITEDEWNEWLLEQKENEFINFVDELEGLKSEYANESIN